MKLNSKIGLSLVLPMLLGVCALGWLIQAQLLQRFAQLEAAELRQQHERLEQAIAADFDSLVRLANDWGEYDETFAYMLGENPQFIASNIVPSTLENLQLDAIALLKPDHSIHDGFTLSADQARLQALPPELAEAISRAARLLPDPAKGQGVIDVGERALAVGVSAILTSDAEGPSQGQLVMARYLSDGTVEALAKRLRSQIHFEPFKVEDEQRRQLRQQLQAQPYVQHIVNDGHIESYSLLKGLDGQPALLMRVGMRRDIMREGRAAVSTLLIMSALAYLLLVLAMFGAVRWVAVSRIGKVARELAAIRDDTDLENKRISAVGRDEISDLARSINHLLQRLVEAFEQRHRSNERQRKLNALLVEIATDESLAECDAHTLCQLLRQPFRSEIGLQYWSLWLDDDEGRPQCLSESDPHHANLNALAETLQQYGEWPGNGEPLTLQGESKDQQRLAFGLEVERRRGALVVDYHADSSSNFVDDLAFLIAATQLIERSLNNHYQHQRELQLRHECEIDALTQLANRSKFELELRQSLNRLDAVGSVAVLFVDLDGFKPINDEHGHAVGDAVLRAVAGRLRESLRDADLVGRFGGDEFVVLLRSVRDSGAVRRVGTKLINALSAPIEVPGVASLIAGCSIGAAMAPRHANQAERLIDLADQAMYKAKHSQGLKFAFAASPEAE